MNIQKIEATSEMLLMGVRVVVLIAVIGVAWMVWRDVLTFKPPKVYPPLRPVPSPAPKDGDA